MSLQIRNVLYESANSVPPKNSIVHTLRIRPFHDYANAICGNEKRNVWSFAEMNIQNTTVDSSMALFLHYVAFDAAIP